jgi:3D (Asp-Asp-Asp) domain-containing protein
MKPFSLALLIALIMMPGAFAGDDDSFLARVTVYWASGASGSTGRCVTGEKLRDGHCAVDPRHIPYGSRVVLPNGETLSAVDTGPAVKNRKAARLAGRTASERNALVIDRFFETKRQALAWAGCHPLFMPIKVVRPRTVAESSSRMTASHPSLAGGRGGGGSLQLQTASVRGQPAICER